MSAKKTFKILMVESDPFIGVNLKKGLENLGHSVTLDSGEIASWKRMFTKCYGNDDFDIVHIHSPNMKKVGCCWKYLKGDTKLVCHWHGSDLRHPSKSFPVLRLMKRWGDLHLFSTIDLQWWLRDVKNSSLFVCPVDTEMFKPDESIEKIDEVLKWGMGLLHWGCEFEQEFFIEHDCVPKFLNNYRKVLCTPEDGLSPFLISVSALEAASCGLEVVHHPYMTREWILKNASIESQSTLLDSLYRHLC